MTAFAVDILLEFRHSSGASVWIDVDDKTAYAYFRLHGGIVADVWLFNVADTPDTPEWRDRNAAPYLNPAEYADQSSPIRNVSEKDFAVEWVERDPDRTSLLAQIIFKGELHAVLTPGEKPGYCRLAGKAGPLALPLSDCPHTGVMH